MRETVLSGSVSTVHSRDKWGKGSPTYSRVKRDGLTEEPMYPNLGYPPWS